MQHNISTPEQWRPVVGYEEIYEVSSHGRVRSVDRPLIYKDGRKGRLSGKIRKTPVGNHGYPEVSLRKNGKSEVRTVHSLVLEAFVSPRQKGMECCHRDGNRQNNHLDNLRWGTSSENQYDIVRLGRDHNRNKSECPRGHLLEYPNIRGAELRRGHRTCLACDRAKSYVRRHPGMSFEKVADEKYRQIVSVNGK